MGTVGFLRVALAAELWLRELGLRLRTFGAEWGFRLRELGLRLWTIGWGWASG